MESIWRNNLISSANSKQRQFRYSLFIPLTYKANSKGDKCPPCGTPEVISTKSEHVPLILTNCFLFDKYEVSQDNKGSQKLEEIRTLNRELRFLTIKNFGKFGVNNNNLRVFTESIHDIFSECYITCCSSPTWLEFALFINQNTINWPLDRTIH